MKNQKKDIRPVRLNLKLHDDYLSKYQRRMLQRYGESETGVSISRDILIPSDMPLHNLHYLIQKLFGWQNTHLHSFELPKEVYSSLVNNQVRLWASLVGVLFQNPSFVEDNFWDDDYAGGSFNAWIKKKYIGPYVYKGIYRHPEYVKEEMDNFLSHYKMVEVRESFFEYMQRLDKDENAKEKIIKKAPLIDLSLEEMNATIMIDGGTEGLMESLLVDKVLANQSEVLNEHVLFPATKELEYTYDFGDNWKITITKYDNCDDLISDNLIDQDELDEAVEIVVSKHKPVCLVKSGMSVLDDVGNLSGFADFLGVVYESDDREDVVNTKRWAKSQGWTDKKVAPKKIL